MLAASSQYACVGPNHVDELYMLYCSHAPLQKVHWHCWKPKICWAVPLASPLFKLDASGLHNSKPWNICLLCKIFSVDKCF